MVFWRFHIKSLFDYGDVKAKNPKPSTIYTLVDEALNFNNGACYSEIEPYLMPPGVCGSRQFDQGEAVRILLKHDSEMNGRIAVIMESKHLSRRMLWDYLQRVLRNAGFRMRHGRLTGLLEHKPDGVTIEEVDESGQPDID
jgi:hypothetical protein